MHSNEELIHRFYTAFEQRDHLAMQASYSAKATFSDPVFPLLQSDQVRAMWKMFCLNGQNLHISASEISADERTGRARWTATYVFSATGRPVQNHIEAQFEFEQGLIVRHRDNFSFYRWSSQALGLSGKLLGWTPLMRQAVRRKAIHSLHQFMQRNTAE